MFLQKRRKKKEVGYSQGIDYFALLLGMVWVLTGMRNFFVWINYPEWNFLLSRWVGGPLVYLHLLPAYYYYGWSFFKEKKNLRLLFNGFFTIVVAVAVITFFQYGIKRGEVTYWGMKHEPNEISNTIFLYGLFLASAPGTIIEFVRRFKKWKKTRSAQDRQLFGFSVGFLIYLLTGALEVLVFNETWVVLLGRIMIMLAPLSFYLSVVWSEQQE
ncbi:MAG: hypothetical protein GF370_01305 [Candidatus Nealsonbacteria bacterium]|nr:hypothetical protein [Candidatus Nealsonbacteria bacterium]